MFIIYHLLSKLRLAKELIQNIVQNKVSVEGTGGAKIEGLNISSPPSQPAFTQVKQIIILFIIILMDIFYFIFLGPNNDTWSKSRTYYWQRR